MQGKVHVLAQSKFGEFVARFDSIAGSRLFTGFPAGSQLRRELAMVSTLEELDSLLDRLDRTVPCAVPATEPRGRQGSPARVALPDGWLTDPDDATVPSGADVMHSGG